MFSCEVLNFLIFYLVSQMSDYHNDENIKPHIDSDLFEPCFNKQYEKKWNFSSNYEIFEHLCEMSFWP